MVTTVRDVMTTDVISCGTDTPIVEAARIMKQQAIGDVLVERDGRLCGIVTDRDIVVRCVADGGDPRTSTVGSICSADVQTLDANATIDDAVELMRETAVRRIPIVEGGRPVGVVSIGDLAVEEEPSSALADISAAPPTE